MSIEVRDLVKIYGSQKAVDQISFTVGKGEIVGFLGPNGAGKSTTMKIITGYLEASSGKAIVCDIPVAEDPIRVKQQIGYLPELNALYYDLYVREYLRFVAEVHQVHSLAQRVEEVIELVGLSPEAHKKVGQLSKGYKQRVGLAAALVHDPEVLILDEPTSGLDPNQILDIREVIRRQGKNKTILFSSHILQEVEALCDRVIIINQGRIVADDLLSNLKKNSGQQAIVHVRFENPVEEDWLRQLTGIDELQQLQPGSYQLFTHDPERVRKQILELALRQNLNIVSLQSESQRLEEVFRSLTRSSAPSSN